jgi:hypothetical protein
MFLADLQDILDDPFLSQEAKLDLIAEMTFKAKIYAKECGQLV